MAIRTKSLEQAFAQLIPVVSIVVGPLSTAIVVTAFAPVDQGFYYLMAALSAVVGLLQLGDVEAAIPTVDRKAIRTFDSALLGITFWRISLAAAFLFLVLILASRTGMLGETREQVTVSVTYLLLVAINAIVAAPHQLSQALAVPYWERRFYEFALYSAVLLVALYLIREPVALVFAAIASTAANLAFSAKVVYLARRMDKSSIDRPFSRGLQFWRIHILPRQTSTGLAHIYAQLGYRLLIPAAAAPLGVVFAGKLGATLAILGLVLGLLQQRLRVVFPAIARVQQRSHGHQRLLRGLEQTAIQRLAIAVTGAGVLFAFGLLVTRNWLSWLTERFVSPWESIGLTLALALTGVVGVKVLFSLSRGRRDGDRAGWSLMLAVMTSVLLPACLGTAFGALGFWAGAILGPLLILVTLRPGYGGADL